MYLRRVIRMGLPFAVATLLAGIIFPSTDAQAYSPDINGARAYANDFCPDVTYPEDKIADVMWLSAPGGGNRVDVIEGGAQDVAITINFYTTFCANWPQGYNNGATDMQAWNGGINRLSSTPGAISYGPKTAGVGARAEWGIGQYGGTLNVAGLGTGEHLFCTYFRTTTDRPGTIFIVSPNICFPIYVNRISPWTIQGESYVKNNTTGGPRSQGIITANLNDTIYWDHDLRNNSSYNMDRDIYYNVDKEGYSGSEAWINANKDQSGWARGVAGQLFVTLYAPGSSFTVKTIYQQDVGAGYNGRPPICQRIAWRDNAYNDGSWGVGVPWACARVPYNYNLTPGVTGPNGVASISSPIPAVMPTVTNQLPGNPGQTTVSESVRWELKRVEVAPGGSIPMTQQENGTAPCAHYGNSCIDKGSGNQAFPAGNTALAALNGEMVGATTPVGTKICYTLSVRPYTQTNGNWRHSIPVCVTVSKQPKLQVWGHDVRTRGSIETGTTLVNSGGSDRLFGSWVEYGGFSVGANNGFASGSGLNTGNTNTTAAAAWHRLTFANINNSGASDFGRFTLSANLPTITAQFIGAPSGGGINSNLGSLGSGTYTAGDFTINTSNVGQTGANGKSIIIVSSGTVTISGNIVYEGNGASGVFTDVKAIPQVVIIARTINILGSVTQIDAWLLTTTPAGMINTCSDVPLSASLNSTVCNKVLTVNGPVATQHLHLRRTAGSNTVATAGDPAEVFNLRPDAYIWAYGRSSQSGKAQTVYSVELPPRF